MKSVSLIICLLSFSLLAQAEEYSLLFSRGQNLQQSRENAMIASGIVPFSCIVANQVGSFIVRCGVTDKKSLLNWQVLMDEYDIKTQIMPYTEGADVVLFEYLPITLSETTQKYLIEIAAKQLNFSAKKNEHQKTEIADVSWDKEQVRQGMYFIDRGWAAYNNKEFILSENLFSLAYKVALLQNAALFGQALTNMELNHLDKSLKQLKKLYQEKFNLNDVLPVLLAVAEQLQDHKTVTEILPELTPEQRVIWQQRLLKIEFSRFVNEKKTHKNDYDKANKFTSLLNNCMALDAWFKLIKQAEKRNYNGSLTWVEILSQTCQKQNELMALAYAGVKLNYKNKGIVESDKFLIMLSSKINNTKLKNKLDKLRFDMLMQAANLEKNLDIKKSLYSKILKIWPNNQNGRQAAAWLEYEIKNYQKAYNLFLPNWQKFGNKKALKGMVYALIGQNKSKKALILAKNNHQEDLYLIALKRMLSDEKIPSKNSFDIAQKVHALEADYQPALAALSWYSFEKKDYLKAKSYFEHWYSLSPLDKSIAQGLLDSMVNLGMLIPALNMAKKIDGVNFKLQPKVLSETAMSAFTKKNYQQAIESFEQIMQKQKLTQAQSSVYAWSLFHQKKYHKSKNEFEQLFVKHDQDDYLQGLISSLENLKDQSALSILYEKLALNSKYDIYTAKNDYQNGQWLNASFTDPSHEIYGNLHKAFIWYDIDWNMKEGDKGISKLDLLTQQLGLSYSFSVKHQINIMLNKYKTDAQIRPQNPSFGRDYLNLFINEQKTTSSEIWPAIEYLYQGKNSVSLNFAKAPLLDEMDKTYWGSLSWRNKSWWVQLYQDGILESQLSLLGQKDPYSSEYFGAAYKKGLQVEYTFTLQTPWLANVSGNFSNIRGQNIIDNREYDLNFSVNRSFDFDWANINGGGFIQWQSYQYNSNAYQFGHGGYFSPQNMGIIGLFSRIHQYDIKNWWYVDLSINYFNWQTKNIALYPLDNRFEQLNEEDKDGIGGAVAAEKHWLISKHWELGAGLQYSISPGYKHAKFGLTLRYLFGARSNLWPRNKILETKRNINSYNQRLVEK